MDTDKNENIYQVMFHLCIYLTTYTICISTAFFITPVSFLLVGNVFKLKLNSKNKIKNIICITVQCALMQGTEMFASLTQSPE